MPAGMSVAFDTLSYARRMEGVGFTRAQAEAMAEEQAKLIDERLATKTDVAAIQADIEALRLSTKADTEALRLATKTDVAAIQADIEALRLSTKADTEALRLSSKADIETLRLSTKAEFELVRRGIELLRRDMTIRLGGIIVAAAAAASTIVTLLSRLPPANP
jgi:uncharacterized protein